MNYRLIRNTRLRKGRLDLLLPIGLIVIAVLFHFFYPATLASVASRVASPFWKGARAVEDALKGTLLFFSSKAALIQDVETLSEKLAEAERLLLDRNLLAEENRLLKAGLGRGEERAGRIIGAILATPPRSPYDTVVLDIGKDDDIAVGDLALSGSAVLGTVTKAYSKTSVVELFSTAGRKTPVSILHEGIAIPVEATGEGKEVFIATIPKEVTVAVGDAVVMPGLNPLAFARVETVESEVTDSFQDIRFKNPVSIGTLRFLEILKSERNGQP